MLKRYLIDNELFFFGAVMAFFYFCLSLFVNIFHHSVPQYIAVFVMLFGIYLVYFFVFQIYRNRDLNKNYINLIFFFSLFFILTMILMVPAEGNDFYHYFFEDLVVTKYQQNPYLVSPMNLPQEPLTYLSYWQFLPSQHGPLRAYLMLPAAWLSFGNIALGIFLYKIISAIFILLCGLLIYKIASYLDSSKSVFIYLLFAWNPLIIFCTFGWGGSDILMLFWLLMAIYFTIKQKSGLAIFALTLSVLVKYVTILLLPLFLIYFWHQSPNSKTKIKSAIFHIFIFIFTIFVFFAPFWKGIKIFDSVVWVGNYFDVGSFPGLINLIFNFIDSSFYFGFLKNIFQIFFAGIYLFFIFKFWREKKADLPKLLYFCIIIFFCYLLLGKYWFYAKYLIWVLPLMFLSEKYFFAPAIFLTGLVVLFLSQTLPVLIIVPTLLFSFYYYFRPENRLKAI